MDLGAQAAQGRYYIFLNDDVEPLSKDWIETLPEYARQPEIGGASPKLLYPDNTIQYAGLVTGVRDLVGTAFPNGIASQVSTATWPSPRATSPHSAAPA